MLLPISFQYNIRFYCMFDDANMQHKICFWNRVFATTFREKVPHGRKIVP